MDTFTVLGALGGVFVFAVGVYQYWVAQRWKRAEFVANEIKGMKSDPPAQAMMQMLDWDGRRAELYPAKQGRDRWVLVTHEVLARALRTRPIDGAPGFESDEARIRDVADAFLDHLERFGHFVEAGLVDAEAFRPYLRYWFELLADTYEARPCGPSVVPQWRDALQAFIGAYGYGGVVHLANELGYGMSNLAVS
jgi:hypothetical protein